jgi:hypothetical protein
LFPGIGEGISYDFYIPRFTMVCDEKQSIIWTLTDEDTLNFSSGDYKF